MRDPTPRQLQVLRAIARFRNRHQFSPTIRELCDLLKPKHRSTNGVNDLLKPLEQKGLITRKKMAARSLVLTEAGWLALHPPKPALLSGSEVA